MKLIPLGFFAIGIFLLTQVVAPVISFEFWALGQRLESNLISPQNTKASSILGVSIQNKDNFSSFVSNLQRETKPNYTKFSLSIPRLKVEKATVFVDSNDLSAGLVQLPGSALPGEKGNLFISGHSALSRFFSLKEVAFSKLSDLKKGDQIILETPGSKFVYEVAGFKVVNPSDISVINSPEEQGRYISLMTCVPPGLNFKRLVVLGKML